MKKKIALFACILFILGSISTVYADENSTAAGSCSFTGKEMVSSFDSNKLAVSVSEMQPGDEVTFSVNIKNDSDISTKWYMSNDVLSSLEDAQSVAANGGYSYILTFVGPDGKEDTIYSKAKELLRERGLAIAAKRSDRETSNGCVLVKKVNDFAAIIALKCETDFVANGADFIKLTSDILDAAIAAKIGRAHV